MKVDELIERLKSKNKKHISRAISLIENEGPQAIDLLNSISKFTGNAYRIGITGPPGAGKSTLTNELTKKLLLQNKSVGIIAIDPTSPFTGGAVLGDRIRMNELGTNPKVFIRSMATRGSLGGLSKKAIDAADVFDASGFDYIIFETVGVGQSELDIAKTADSTMVILVPESGDSVQAMKAGIMEIADFFVMNKCDRPGAENAILSLQTTLMFRDHDESSYLPKIIKCTASKGKGIEDVLSELKSHRDYLINSNSYEVKRKNNTRLRTRKIVERNLAIDIWDDERNNLLEDDSSSPYLVAEKIISHYKKEILDKK